MKRKISITILLLAFALASIPAIGALFYVATGTPVKNASFAMSLPTTAKRVLFINNRTANVVYFKLNDSATTPTASATSYDIALDQNESEQVGREVLLSNPIRYIGCFCAETTATIRITGY